MPVFCTFCNEAHEPYEPAVDRLAQAQQIVVSEVGMLRGQLSMGAAVERALNRGGDGAVVAHLTGPRAGSITIPALAKPRVLERK